MSKKIVLIGAGSYVFTRNLVRDILTFPAFRDAEIALVDIDPKVLDFSRKAVQRIIEAGNYPAKVTATMSDDEVNEVYEKGAKIWIGLDHEIDALRQAWLLKKFTER